MAALDIGPGAMTPTKAPRRLGWRKAAFAAAAVGLNAGAVVLLSMTDPGLRARSLRPAPMIVYLEDAWPSLVHAPRAPSVTSSEAAVAAPQRAQASQGDAPNRGDPARSASPPPPSPSSMSQANADDGIDARWRVGGALAGPRLSSLSCNAPHRLAPHDRRRCEERWSGGEAAPVIRGTGNGRARRRLRATGGASSGGLGSVARRSATRPEIVRRSQPCGRLPRREYPDRTLF